MHSGSLKMPGTFVHLFEPLGFFSTTYFSILAPPSSGGGFHAKAIELAVMPVVSIGPLGLAGASEIRRLIVSS